MKPLKIAFLMTQSLDSPTGIGRIGPLARGLARLGYQVEIYALHPNFDSLPQKDFVEQGVHVSYVAPMHVIKQGNEKKYYSVLKTIQVVIYATWKLSIAALHSEANLIHISKPHPMNGIAGLLTRISKKKIIFVDCDDYEAGSGNFKYPWQKWVVAFFEKNIPRFAKLVTTNTFYMHNKLVSWGIPAERISYLPNGYEPTRFTKPNEIDVLEMKAKLGLEGRKTVLYVGSLSLVNHPVDLLMKAFVNVQLTIPNSALLIVGGGEDYDFLVRKSQTLGIDQNTIFAGRIAPVEVTVYYRLSDVSVDPVYNNEASRGRSPLKMYESWASGVPFVTSDVGDRVQLLGSPPAGEITQSGNSDSLAESIIRILNDEKLAGELSQRGAKRVESYSWDRLSAGLGTIYKSYV